MIDLPGMASSHFKTIGCGPMIWCDQSPLSTEIAPAAIIQTHFPEAEVKARSLWARPYSLLRKIKTSLSEGSTKLCGKWEGLVWACLDDQQNTWGAVEGTWTTPKQENIWDMISVFFKMWRASVHKRWFLPWVPLGNRVGISVEFRNIKKI